MPEKRVNIDQSLRKKGFQRTNQSKRTAWQILFNELQKLKWIGCAARIKVMNMIIENLRKYLRKHDLTTNTEHGYLCLWLKRKNPEQMKICLMSHKREE